MGDDCDGGAITKKQVHRAPREEGDNGPIFPRAIILSLVDEIYNAAKNIMRQINDFKAQCSCKHRGCLPYMIWCFKSGNLHLIGAVKGKDHHLWAIHHLGNKNASEYLGLKIKHYPQKVLFRGKFNVPEDFTYLDAFADEPRNYSEEETEKMVKASIQLSFRIKEGNEVLRSEMWRGKDSHMEENTFSNLKLAACLRVRYLENHFSTLPINAPSPPLQLLEDLTEMPPVGLWNKTNVCYLNAAIQFILHTPLLFKGIIERYNSCIVDREEPPALVTFFVEIIRRAVQNQQGSVISASEMFFNRFEGHEILSSLKHKATEKEFSRLRQYDSVELLTKILDVLVGDELNAKERLFQFNLRTEVVCDNCEVILDAYDDATLYLTIYDSLLDSSAENSIRKYLTLLQSPDAEKEKFEGIRQDGSCTTSKCKTAAQNISRKYFAQFNGHSKYLLVQITRAALTTEKKKKQKVLVGKGVNTTIQQVEKTVPPKNVMDFENVVLGGAQYQCIMILERPCPQNSAISGHYLTHRRLEPGRWLRLDDGIISHESSPIRELQSVKKKRRHAEEGVEQLNSSSNFCAFLFEKVEVAGGAGGVETSSLGNGQQESW